MDRNWEDKVGGRSPETSLNCQIVLKGIKYVSSHSCLDVFKATMQWHSAYPMVETSFARKLTGRSSTPSKARITTTMTQWYN